MEVLIHLGSIKRGKTSQLLVKNLLEFAVAVGLYNTRGGYLLFSRRHGMTMLMLGGTHLCTTILK